MKKLGVFIAFFVLILLVSPVYAQNETIKENEAGVTPDNGFMWGMERAAESVSLAFTFNETKKAQKSLEYANERAAEAQKMAQENKSEASEKAMKNWEKNINSAEQIRNRLQENNQSKQAERIRERMQNAEGTLERVRNRIMNDDNPNNDNALQGLDKALGNVRGNMSDVMGKGGTGRDEAGKEGSVPGSGSSGKENISDGEKTGGEETTQNTSGEKGKLNLMVSDAPADIGDFDSLVVSFSHARVFERNSENNTENEETNTSNETDKNLNNETNSTQNNETTNNTKTGQEQNQVKERKGFSIIELNGEEVDLTQVVGEKAEEIASVYLSDGTYNKIELHVQNVTGIVDGEEVEVMVPSNKLQIVKPFTISKEEPLDFVFDINVVKKGQGDNYNLLPVISKSGTVGKDVGEIENVSSDKKSNVTGQQGQNNKSVDENNPPEDVI